MEKLCNGETDSKVKHCQIKLEFSTKQTLEIKLNIQNANRMEPICLSAAWSI